MSTPLPFDPQSTFARVRNGDWPQYEAVYQRYVVGEQVRETQAAEGLRLLQLQDKNAEGHVKDPQRAEILDARADSWWKQFKQDLKKSRKGCGRLLIRAQKLVDTQTIAWHFTVRGLIVLAVIYLREETGDKSRIEAPALRTLVEQHHFLNGQPSRISDKYWYDVIREPDLAALLLSQEQS